MSKEENEKLVKKYSNLLKTCWEEAKRVVHLTNRGMAFWRLGEHEDALRDATRAIEIDSEFYHAYNFRGHVYSDIGRCEDAIRDLTTSIKIKNNDFRTFSFRGLVYIKMKKWGKALSDLNRAIRLNSKDSYAYTNRGVAFLEMKKFVLARKDFDKAIQLDSKNTKAFLKRGKLSFVEDKYQEAKNEYIRALSILEEKKFLSVSGKELRKEILNCLETLEKRPSDVKDVVDKNKLEETWKGRVGAKPRSENSSLKGKLSPEIRRLSEKLSLKVKYINEMKRSFEGLQKQTRQYREENDQMRKKLRNQGKLLSSNRRQLQKLLNEKDEKSAFEINEKHVVQRHLRVSKGIIQQKDDALKKLRELHQRQLEVVSNRCKQEMEDGKRKTQIQLENLIEKTKTTYVRFEEREKRFARAMRETKLLHHQKLEDQRVKFNGFMQEMEDSKGKMQNHIGHLIRKIKSRDVFLEEQERKFSQTMREAKLWYLQKLEEQKVKCGKSITGAESKFKATSDELLRRNNGSGEGEIPLQLLKNIEASDIERGEVIDKGGYGVVFRATWNGEGGGVDVCLKELNLKRSKINVEDIRKELKMLCKLNHPCVCNILGHFVDSNRYYIVMELLENSLWKFLENCHDDLTFFQMFMIMKRMAISVNYLSMNEIVHRDIRADNFLVSFEGRVVKITDFGISKFKTALQTTVLTTFKGDSRWQPKECFGKGKRPFSSKSDVYSLAMSFYQVLFNRLPFEGMDDVIEKVGKAVVKQTPSLGNYDKTAFVAFHVIPKMVKDGIRPKMDNSSVPKKMKELIKEMWDDDKNKRMKIGDVVQWFRSNEKEFKKNFSKTKFVQ